MGFNSMCTRVRTYVRIRLFTLPLCNELVGTFAIIQSRRILSGRWRLQRGCVSVDFSQKKKNTVKPFGSPSDLISISINAFGAFVNAPGAKNILTIIVYFHSTRETVLFVIVFFPRDGPFIYYPSMPAELGNVRRRYRADRVTQRLAINEHRLYRHLLYRL